MGDNLVDDIEFILKHNYDTKMSSTKSHTQPKNDEEYIKNNEEFNNLDKTKGDNLAVFVHGTNSSPEDADPKFIKAMSDTYKEEIIQLRWSGENNKKARSKAAKDLLDLVQKHKFKEGEKLNLGGHSHGGNVLKKFTNIYQGDKKIDNMVFLGTPVRDDYKLNNKVLSKDSKVLNVYDKSDIWQVLGGTDSDYFGLAERIINNPRVNNIKVETPNNINIYNIINPIGSAIFDSLSNDHTEMDNKKVWDEINEK